MTRAEELAQAYENGLDYYHYTGDNPSVAYKAGYEQAEKDTIVEVEKWLKAEFHHHNCWNADEFCVSLRTHFGIEK